MAYCLSACRLVRLKFRINAVADSFFVVIIYDFNRSPPNAQGVFKIPMLSKRHYNINVYSQMVDDKIDSSYEEVKSYFKHNYVYSMETINTFFF